MNWLYAIAILAQNAHLLLQMCRRTPPSLGAVLGTIWLNAGFLTVIIYCARQLP